MRLSGSWLGHVANQCRCQPPCVNQKSWMFYGMIHWSIQQGCTKMHSRYLQWKRIRLRIFHDINFHIQCKFLLFIANQTHHFFFVTWHFHPPTSTSDFLEVNRTFRIVLILIPFSTGLWRKSLHPTRPLQRDPPPPFKRRFRLGRVVNVVGCARNRPGGGSFSGRIFDRTSRRSRNPNCLRRHVLLILMGRAGWCLIWGLG